LKNKTKQNTNEDHEDTDTTVTMLKRL